MNILLLAPHPFYQERGTPIAVDLLLRVLSGQGHTIDVVTFHEGAPRVYPGVTFYRIAPFDWIRGVPPGFSWKKIICDIFLLGQAVRLARKNRYQLVHAVEEAAFMAMLLRRLFGLPYVFDMDSSLPRQLVEQRPALAAIAPLLRFFEAWAIRRAVAVVAVCEALAEIARLNQARRVFVLRDISLLSLDDAAAAAPREPPFQVEKPCLMYIGNLEKYQGIELLLESFAALVKSLPQAYLAIIGGNENTIRQHERWCRERGIAARVCFYGPQPLARLGQLFAQADLLVSPRIQGANTPMKIYSYLQSGKPILATDLPTHTQVLDQATAMLAAPNPREFSSAMLRLLQNPQLGARLAQNARRLAEEKYSFAVYQENLAEAYRQISRCVAASARK